MKLSEEKIRSIIRSELLKEELSAERLRSMNVEQLEDEILKYFKIEKYYGMSDRTVKNFLIGIKKGKESVSKQLNSKVMAYKGSGDYNKNILVKYINSLAEKAASKKRARELRAASGPSAGFDPEVSWDSEVSVDQIDMVELPGETITTPRPGSKATGNKTVKEIQRIVDTKDDGTWGPNTQRAWTTWVTLELSSMGRKWTSAAPQIVKGWKSGSIVASDLAGKKFAPTAAGNLAFLKYLQAESGKNTASTSTKPDEVTTGREKKDSQVTGSETVVKVRRKGKTHIFRTKRGKNLTINSKKIKKIVLRYKEPTNVTSDNLSDASISVIRKGPNKKRLNDSDAAKVLNSLKNYSEAQLRSMFDIESK